MEQPQCRGRCRKELCTQRGQGTPHTPRTKTRSVASNHTAGIDHDACTGYDSCLDCCKAVHGGIGAGTGCCCCILAAARPVPLPQSTVAAAAVGTGAGPGAVDAVVAACGLPFGARPLLLRPLRFAGLPLTVAAHVPVSVSAAAVFWTLQPLVVRQQAALDAVVQEARPPPRARPLRQARRRRCGRFPLVHALYPFALLHIWYHIHFKVGRRWACAWQAFSFPPARSTGMTSTRRCRRPWCLGMPFQTRPGTP